MWTALIISLVAAAVGIGSALYFKEPDRPIEEISEYIIEQQFDFESGTIDLTPSSKEKTLSV